MPDITINISSSIVAWYAAVIATGALVFQIITVLRDRKRVNVSVSFNNRIVGDNLINPYKENTDYMEIKVVNNGKRPVVITSIGAEFLKGGGLLPTDFLKKGATILKEGEFVKSFVEQKLIDLQTIKCFSATDSTGKKYKSNVANSIRRFWWALRRFYKI